MVQNSKYLNKNKIVAFMVLFNSVKSLRPHQEDVIMIKVAAAAGSLLNKTFIVRSVSIKTSY